MLEISEPAQQASPLKDSYPSSCFLLLVLMLILKFLQLLHDILSMSQTETFCTKRNVIQHRDKSHDSSLVYVLPLYNITNRWKAITVQVVLEGRLNVV